MGSVETDTYTMTLWKTAWTTVWTPPWSHLPRHDDSPLAWMVPRGSPPENGCRTVPLKARGTWNNGNSHQKYQKRVTILAYRYHCSYLSCHPAIGGPLAGFLPRNSKMTLMLFNEWIHSESILMVRFINFPRRNVWKITAMWPMWPKHHMCPPTHICTKNTVLHACPAHCDPILPD